MDRLDAMAILLAAVDSGSLSKASKNLGQPLATVSRKVAELEAHLNASLLIRSAKGLELTPAGRSYVAAARSILEQLTEAERSAAGEYTEPKGDLVVTAPIMFGRLHALPVVTQFLAAFPEVSVGLVLTDRVSHLVDDQVDVALRIGELPDSSLIALRLGAVRRVTCASPDYLGTHGAPLTPADVARHHVISLRSVSAPGEWIFDGADGPISTPLRARLSVSTIDAGIDAALAGVGLLRSLSYQLADHVRGGRLKIVLEPFEPPPRPVHMIYDKRNRLPLKLRAFIDFAAPRLRDRLTQAALPRA